ncbi:DUF2642 domain-containing protein [Bacillus amyloliquefaciens]|uniref:DUF2642 domain-containing protein n=1 Tax=Bacillus amyloliquefaciens TaxID=1390 RepID=UPI00225675D4|nr:DUF2642 domain-containing protein [Bacillus amyloliquefaciens]MCX4185282.1 YuzF family protein [Bacillus amyloliquefaciens]
MAHQGSPQIVTLVDPYVYQTIHKLIGSRFIIQTVRRIVRGRLIDATPDHIAIEETHDRVFYIRNRHVVSVMPDYTERV